MPTLHYLIHAVMTLVIAFILKCNVKFPYSQDGDITAEQADKESICFYESKEKEYRVTDAVHLVSDAREITLTDIATSGRCFGSSRVNRICHFRHLCYNTKHEDFVFFYGNNSMNEYLPDDSPLLDLSSVNDHNLHYFAYSSIPASSSIHFNISWIRGTSLIFNRFKPDNIMHVLHDDILPMYQTLKFIAPETARHKPFDIQLIFMEGWSLHEFSSLYGMFSTKEIKLKDDLTSMSEFVCIEEAYVGISKVPTWYQYGFTNPQGPIPDSSATSVHIHSAVKFMKQRLSLKEESTKMSYFLLISRKYNRLIINEDELVLALAQEFNLKIISVSLDSHDIEAIIGLICGASLVVGMHGSLLSLAMFLKPGSVLLELFPYGINPQNYTPYKTLSKISGMNIIYRSWQNHHVVRTVTHPDWTSAEGGIHHLDKIVQSEIASQAEVPPHLCCSDPAWLFRIYQDTEVDISELKVLIYSALEERKTMQMQTDTKDDQMIENVIPAKVQNLSCFHNLSMDSKNLIFVSWLPPWNIQYLIYDRVYYEIIVQNADTKAIQQFEVTENEYNIDGNVDHHSDYYIWVRCIIHEDRKGPYESTLSCS